MDVRTSDCKMLTGALGVGVESYNIVLKCPLPALRTLHINLFTFAIGMPLQEHDFTTFNPYIHRPNSLKLHSSPHLLLPSGE